MMFPHDGAEPTEELDAPRVHPLGRAGKGNMTPAGRAEACTPRAGHRAAVGEAAPGEPFATLLGLTLKI